MQRTFLYLVLLLALAACRSKKIDNSMIVEPDPGVSFAADVEPIFRAGCGGFGCHVGEATNGVDLTTHASTLASVGLQYGGLIVVPGDASGSPLVDKISANPQQGSRMPLGLPALSATEVQVIRTWIDEGAEDN